MCISISMLYLSCMYMMMYIEETQIKIILLHNVHNNVMVYALNKSNNGIHGTNLHDEQ